MGIDLSFATFRTHDAAIGRWLQVDPASEATYGLTPYNSMGNNPIRYSDPNGDFIPQMLLGAGIGVLTNGIGNLANGNGFFDGAGKAALFGAIGGAVSFGIGNVATSMAANGVSSFGVGAFQAGAHGLSGGFMSASQGGSFQSGFLSGALSSGMSSIASNAGVGNIGMIGIGGLSGGVGSSIAGGSFWKGVGQGLITSGLNHGAHAGMFGDDFAMSLFTGRARHMFGPDAIGIGGEIGGAFGMGVNIESGKIKMLRGDQIGEIEPYLDGGNSFGVDVNLGFTSTKYYYGGSIDNLSFSNSFSGKFTQYSGSAGLGFDIGGSFSRSAINQFGYRTYGLGITLGGSPSPIPFGFSILRGTTFINP